MVQPCRRRNLSVGVLKGSLRGTSASRGDAALDPPRLCRTVLPPTSPRLPHRSSKGSKDT